MRFEVVVHELAESELAELRTFDRRLLLDAMESQLAHQPTQATRNRKRLDGLTPKFEHVPPVWELRVGVFRIFYDVDESIHVVNVRAVRRKWPHQTTEQIT